MRRFFVSLIILILAAGAVFFIGWIQFRLPANTYGVIFTKTGGFESSVVRPGTFAWRWQALLPRNLRLFAFDISPQTTEITAQGILPSGAVYAQTLEGHPNFSFKLTFSLTYNIKPSSLPRLAADDGLTPETVGKWYSAFTQLCRSTAISFISDRALSGPNVNPANLQLNLSQFLVARFPDIDFIDVAAVSVDLPDMDLYRRAKGQYLSVMAAELEPRRDAAAKKAGLESEAAQKIALLKKYGDLFNQYPVLLKFLDIDSAKRQDVIPGF